MLKKSFLLILVLPLLLAACDVMDVLQNNEQSKSPSDDQGELDTVKALFLNQSAYDINVAPDGQEWDSFFLVRRNGRKTLEIESTEIAYMFDMAAVVNDEHSGTEDDMIVTFVDAVMYTHRFWNLSEIWLTVQPADGQIWQSFRLPDQAWGVYASEPNKRSLNTKYENLSFTLVKTDGGNHMDGSLVVDDISVSAEGIYDFVFRSP